MNSILLYSFNNVVINVIFFVAIANLMNLCTSSNFDYFTFVFCRDILLCVSINDNCLFSGYYFNTIF